MRKTLLVGDHRILGFTHRAWPAFCALYKRKQDALNLASVAAALFALMGWSSGSGWAWEAFSGVLMMIGIGFLVSAIRDP